MTGIGLMDGKEKEAGMDVKKTITPRLRLYEEDARKLMKTAHSYGMTAEELLEAFIADLIDGRETHGSDERLYARQWIDRCMFMENPLENFALYLDLVGVDMSEVLMIFDDLEDFGEAQGEGEYDEDELEMIEDGREYIRELYEDYCKEGGRHAQSYEEAADSLRRYAEYRKRWQG